MGFKLFSTVIGSHIWKMNRPDSDWDIFEVYIAPSTEILKGRLYTSSEFKQKDNVDTAIHEIGKVISQTIKGNLNFLIGIMSPITVETSPYHQELKTLVQQNLSKNCFQSIHGMSKGNYLKYIASGKDPSETRCNKVYRVIKYGIHLLRTGTFKFEPTYDTTPSMIEQGLDELKGALERSPLPDTTDPEPFENFLLNLRLDELNRKLVSTTTELEL